MAWIRRAAVARFMVAANYYRGKKRDMCPERRNGVTLAGTALADVTPNYDDL
jgi:hypothetical protein